MGEPNPWRRRPPSQSKCCGVIEEAAHRTREKRAARRKAQPWAVRKLMVVFTLAVIGYSVYVFVGRLCVDMIKRKQRVDGSRGTGIALLVVFSVLFLWVVWAYLKVLITPPGFARDHISKSERPLYPEPTSFYPYDSTVEGTRYPMPPRSHSHGPSQDFDQDSIGGPSYENISPRPSLNVATPSLGPLAAVATMTVAPTSGNENGNGNRTVPSKSEPPQMKEKAAVDYIQRRPSTTPVLRPEHRYCSIDEVVKPYRTHHCRTCGTCVLKYDHHCPWIGQCVGARNHKFFMNFVQATSVYTIYICAVLITFTVLAARSVDRDIDPQRIVIIALSAVFALFTTLLQITHMRLMWLSQTTLESLQAKHMKHREEQAMDDVLGWCAFREKLRKRRAYDEEWGRIGLEGNIWWLGSGRDGWEEVMGKNPWGWFLPIGRSLNDGLTYPVNPRFDEQGVWRRRIEWPQELR